jgi:hypothetical protein
LARSGSTDTADSAAKDCPLANPAPQTSTKIDIHCNDLALNAWLKCIQTSSQEQAQFI